MTRKDFDRTVNSTVPLGFALIIILMIGAIGGTFYYWLVS